MAKTNLKNIQTVQHIGSIEQIYVPQNILAATNPHYVLGSIGVVLMSCKVHSHVIRSALQNPNFLRHIRLRSFVLDEKSPENETSRPPTRQRLPKKIFRGGILYPFLWLVLKSSKERNVNVYSYFDSRKVGGKNVLVTIPKGNIGYDQHFHPTLS